MVVYRSNRAMGAFRIFLQLIFFRSVASEISFVYNGFSKTNLTMYGISCVNSNGLLEVTDSSPKVSGRALYPTPLRFKENTTVAPVVSFSTTFVFCITPKYQGLGGHGIVFALLPAEAPHDFISNQYFGLPNISSNGSQTTQAVVVEFDIVHNVEMGDINDNHVGIDIDGFISNVSLPAAYYTGNNRSENKSINLKGGDPVQAWIDYDGKEKLMVVSISPLGISRPVQPLLSYSIDLSPVLAEYMYVGFSAATGLLTATHDILGWSFKIGGKAEELDLSKLPPLMEAVKMVHRKGFAVGIALACISLVLLVILGAHQILEMRKNADEVPEEWEIEYGTRRFEYSDLTAATRGFDEHNLIGFGGFGNVYKGIVPSTGLEVAIKRIAHDSKQGLREFVAEIMSMGQLRHRNLVQLHGWCRRKDELLLVYEYVPNGSLDKLLFSNHTIPLTWDQRYRILVGVAQALLYLHEECELRVVHRDVKPSNVLIDVDLNAKLGDFGLARIYDHGVNPQTTRIVGTLGYLVPELTRTGKATTSTDVYAYGALLLEVASGRRPIEPLKVAEELVLVNWVRELHSKGGIMKVMDNTLDSYNTDQAELILSLGLLCSHPLPSCRPSMRRVVQFLLGDAVFPPLPTDIHLEDPGLIAYPSDLYLDDSNPSSSMMTSSKSSTSFTSLDKNLPAQISRATC